MVGDGNTPSSTGGRADRLDTYLTDTEKRHIDGVVFVSDAGSCSAAVRDAIMEYVPKIDTGDVAPPEVPGYDGEQDCAVQVYVRPEIGDMVRDIADDGGYSSVSDFLRAVIDLYVTENYGERLDVLVGLAD